MTDKPKIPLCRSEFLQEFTIALGQNLQREDHFWRSFVAQVDQCEHENQTLERFAVWISTYYDTRINLTLWEDKTVLVRVALLPTENGEKFELGFYPSFELLGFERIVEALIETVSISTRLCYDESPEPLMRQIWNFNGEVKIEGVI